MRGMRESGPLAILNVLARYPGGLHGPSAADVAAELDDLTVNIRRQLERLERDGGVQRLKRDGGPWKWELTPVGRQVVDDERARQAAVDAELSGKTAGEEKRS